MNTNNWDWLGAYKQDFSKSSPQVFCNLSDNLQYIGKADNEVEIDPGISNVEWKDNSGKTQVLYALDIDAIDLMVNFSMLQLYDKNTFALAMNGELDESDANVNRVYLGSEPQDYAEGEWRFIWQSVDGRQAKLIIRRGIVFSTGSFTLGSPGDYTRVPVQCRALQDTSITNTQRDLAYFEITKRTTT